MTDSFATLVYERMFDLTEDSLFLNPLDGTNYTSEDIFPLENRFDVLHGNLPPATGGSGGPDLDIPHDTGEFKVFLPVDRGEEFVTNESGNPTAVPAPTEWSLFALLTHSSRSRSRSADAAARVLKRLFTGEILDLVVGLTQCAGAVPVRGPAPGSRKSNVC